MTPAPTFGIGDASYQAAGGIAGIVTLPTLAGALVPPAIYVTIHAIEGNFVTPNLLGRTMTINPFLIFLSLTYWIWAWGPVGGLVAVLVAAVPFNATLLIFGQTDAAHMIAPLATGHDATDIGGLHAKIQKQLHKLVDVLKVCDLSEGEHIEREIALVKARAAGGARDELKRLADIFRGQIVDVTASVYTVQLSGTSDKLDSFIQAIGTASILETVRSGVTGIARGDKVLSI